MDPDNPVVRLCARGMEAEQAGDAAAARALFQQAWDAHTDAYEGCVAAHYLARHQNDDEATRRWNLTALTLAGRADADEVAGFLPSLHLNMASSHQALGDVTAARAHLAVAERTVGALPDTPYAAVVRRGITNVRAGLDGDGTGPGDRAIPRDRAGAGDRAGPGAAAAGHGGA